jgi:hypothetical protein
MINKIKLFPNTRKNLSPESTVHNDGIRVEGISTYPISKARCSRLLPEILHSQLVAWHRSVLTDGDYQL